MDERDLQILRMLKENSRLKYVEVAKALGLTEGAVRRRIKKLKEHGIIRKFTIETSVELEGIILIETEADKTENVADRVREICDKVFEVSGEYDIAALIQAYTIEELNRSVDEIRKLPGVLSTKTLIKLKD
ncbi:MAG: Lrp/AsnC family transcriptional regulator [Candidatus Bathyarchaeia archaeon]